MPRLVLPSGVATSTIEKHFQAGWFSRVLGFCWIPTEYTSYRGLAESDLTSHEVMVGHQNVYRPGTVCWEENDIAWRGAVRFPLTLRDVTSGFHEREQAWLTWRKVNGERTEPFFGCTQALVMLGRAEFDWVAGAYKNGSTAERRNLHITGSGSVISDADASVPRSGTPNLRRVEVTDLVRDWVERGLPNFGFVLMGDERFRRPSRPVTGRGIGPGPDILWQGCLGVYTGFELVFAPIGYNPSYGRAAADL